MSSGEYELIPARINQINTPNRFRNIESWSMNFGLGSTSGLAASQTFQTQLATRNRAHAARINLANILASAMPTFA